VACNTPELLNFFWYRKEYIMSHQGSKPVNGTLKQTVLFIKRSNYTSLQLAQLMMVFKKQTSFWVVGIRYKNIKLY